MNKTIGFTVGFILVFVIGFTFILNKLDNLLGDKNATIKTITLNNSKLQNRIKELEAVRTKSKLDIQEYILTYYKTVAPVVAEAVAINILKASERHDVPFVAVVAVMQVESQFNPAAISSKGARGLMQVMPKIWMNELNLTSKYDFHNIQIGINSGTYILRKYLDQTKNNMERALYKYVGGENLYVKKVYAAMGKFVVYRSFANMTVNEEVKEIGVQDFDVPKIKDTPFVHTVTHRGETLSLIAQWYTGKTSNWKAISKLNASIVPKRMPIGARITIPQELLKTTITMTKEFVTNINSKLRGE